ncbi:MAG: serpin family protein [Firmicutes bacterium]|nr:serpin family protein [Bacillota bacterium]
MKKITVLVMILAMVFALAACGGGNAGSTQSLTPGQQTGQEQTEEPTETPANADVKAMDFAVRLFKVSLESGKNTLISPFSVLSALAMTANGAGGDTLAEMEAVLGMSLDELNAYIKAYSDSLPVGEKYKLDPANSIWFNSRDSFSVNEDFIKKIAANYDADIFKADFDDATLKDINDWVKGKTDGMIPEILDQISPDAVMYLINALAFEAEWIEPYFEDQVHESEFTTEDGTKEKVDLMYSEENTYLESENATGVIKYYKEGKYAFAALLPKEGTTVEELVESLDGAKLQKILADRQNTTTYTAIPKFETEYGTEMSRVLMGMGMPLAFDPANADFSNLGTAGENVFIGRVIHKTFISVAEQGTRAGAATIVEMLEGAALMEEEPKEVILDRPFVYMLIDCETYTPFFIGTLMHVK